MSMDDILHYRPWVTYIFSLNRLGIPRVFRGDFMYKKQIDQFHNIMYNLFISHTKNMFFVRLQPKNFFQTKKRRMILWQT